MKFLVSGGAGFIGSNIVEMLVEKGHEVVVLDAFTLGSMDNLSKVKDKVKVIDGSILDDKIVNEASQGVDTIFNLAAASSSPMFMEDLKKAVAVNVEGFDNILQAAVKNNVRRVVYASTSVVYGSRKEALREDVKLQPPNFYSATKLMNEYMAFLFGQEYGLESIGFRFMSIFGPHEKSKGIFANLVSQFIWDMKKGEQPILYGDGTQTRDFTYVKDVARAHVMAMESKKKHLGEVLNIGTGIDTSLLDLVKILNKILGTSIEPKCIENPVKNYMMYQKSDISKTKDVIGFEPKFTLEEGIKDMLKDDV